MDNLGAIFAIGAVIVIPIVLIVMNRAVSVKQERVTNEREREARELEIKIRMSSGLDVVNDFNELARVYLELDRAADAEQCMQKAVGITESELGRMDPALIPILENYANVLEKMNRRVEAEKIRKRASEIPPRR
jgi:tetratricopeptide (TPR) repeat protein